MHLELTEPVNQTIHHKASMNIRAVITAHSCSLFYRYSLDPVTKYVVEIFLPLFLVLFSIPHVPGSMRTGPLLKPLTSLL